MYVNKQSNIFNMIFFQINVYHLFVYLRNMYVNKQINDTIHHIEYIFEI